MRDVDVWHRENGYKRTNPLINPELTSIGYHFVVYLDGTVQTGRRVEEIGAHAYGHNQHSIGICLIGTDKFMRAQWLSVSELLHSLIKAYPAAEVMGHRDL